MATFLERIDFPVINRGLRRWLTSSVYRAYQFRKLYNSDGDSENKTRIDQKIKHLDKKTDFLKKRGQSLGLTPEQMQRVNSFVVEQVVKQKKEPKIIIQELLIGGKK